MPYTLVSMLCIAAMLVILIYLIVRLCSFNRAERIEYILNFKKGKCAIIYIVAFPLFFMAANYAEKSITDSIFDAISKSVNLVVLKYEFPTKLIQENTMFAIAIYMCFTLVAINAMMITLSFLHQSWWSWKKLRKFHRANGDKCIIVGNNTKSSYIYNSCNCKKMIADVLSKDAQKKLYALGTTYKAFASEELLYSWIKAEINKSLKKLCKTNNKLNIIINNENEQKNLSMCGRFLELINTIIDNGYFDTAVNRIEIYVLGNREFEDIYSKYEEAEHKEKKAGAFLHYINEYGLIAMDFIDKYPLTEYMDERQIDYSEFLIRNDIDINVAMIGFGRTNQQIFLSMVANNQFLTRDPNGKIVNRPVSYHLFDKLHTGNHKSLNHNYFRYEHDYYAKNGIKENEDKYLPLVDLPEKHEYHYLDINDICFYDDLRCSISPRDNAINYIIVSLGDDYLNIDIANKIAVKLKEWKLENSCKVFVRIRDKKVNRDADKYFDADFCHPFGTEEEVSYHYSHIIKEKFSEMAIMRNFVYDIEHDMRHDKVSIEEMERSRVTWFKKPTIYRESNVYACLGLRSKLHLMGLDYCKNNEENKDLKALSQDEYMNIYARDDMPAIEKDANGNQKAIRYSIDFKDSARKNLAMQEHSRWCAYHFMKGYVPATIEEIKSETSGKNLAMRTHGNLTTMEGLVEFRKIISDRDKTPEEDNDVIKYDYQLLDGAWWILNKNGYKIVKRIKEQRQ